MQLTSLLQGIAHRKCYEFDFKRGATTSNSFWINSKNSIDDFGKCVHFLSVATVFGVQSVTQRGKHPANAINAHGCSACWKNWKPIFNDYSQCEFHIDIFDTWIHLNFSFDYKIFLVSLFIRCTERNAFAMEIISIEFKLHDINDFFQHFSFIWIFWLKHTLTVVQHFDVTFKIRTLNSPHLDLCGTFWDEKRNTHPIRERKGERERENVTKSMQIMTIKQMLNVFVSVGYGEASFGVIILIITPFVTFYVRNRTVFGFCCKRADKSI